MLVGPRNFSAAALAVALVSVASASAEPFRLEKKFDLAAGDRFVLSSSIGGVTLRGVEGRQASILVTSDREDLATRFDFRFEQAGGQLKVLIEPKDKGLASWFRQFRGNVHIAVEVPRATPVDVNTSGGGIDLSALDANVKANSSGGGIKVAEVHGDVNLSSSGGGVEVSVVQGAVRLQSSGGGVRGESLGGSVYAESSGGGVTLKAVIGDVDANSSGGGVEIQEAGGRVKASSSGGPVQVVFAAGNAKGGDLDSSGGGIVATLDPAAGLDLDASTSSGSVHCDLPVTVQGRISADSLHGKVHGGGALLHVRSSGGGITINGR
ncbi:MAG: DUF4097 family beta strand repeat-containing protein [Vicinamibacteria bacterium]